MTDEEADVIDFKTSIRTISNWGKCKNCKLLDTSSREEFPDGKVRQGSCVAHPIQPNGKWDEDRCDMIQYGLERELDSDNKPGQMFVFAAKDGA